MYKFMPEYKDTLIEVQYEMYEDIPCIEEVLLMDFNLDILGYLSNEQRKEIKELAREDYEAERQAQADAFYEYALKE